MWEALSTEYHESAPGHHLQLAQMMYQADSLTRFQRLGVAISGHGEGWALYAERLMHELGYLDDPVYELGWLVGQALRAARVILDIGLHCEMRIPGDERFHPGEDVEVRAGLAIPTGANGPSARSSLPPRSIAISACRVRRSRTRSANACGSTVGTEPADVSVSVST